MNPEISRRRLLTALALSPLVANFPLLAAEQNGERIIALEWLPLELMVALGVMPIAAADLYSYRDWVGEPKLPSSIIDVGLRTEPNMELMIQLKPTLILYSSGYGPSVSKIERVAPGMGFAFNSGNGKPLTTARESLMTLAHRLDRVPQANAHLAELAALIAQTKNRLQQRGNRPLLLLSILDPRHAIVFGKGSLFVEIMDEMGVENAWQEESNFWGTAVVGIERLAKYKNVEAICFSHGNQAMMQQVASSALWQALPFVRDNHFQVVPQVWFYGATLSAMNFCRVIDRALEA